MKIIRFGLSGNPVTVAHQMMARTLADQCDQLIIAVCGPRDDKDSSRLINAADRAALAVLGFVNLPINAKLDLSDLTRLGECRRTPTYTQMVTLRESMPRSDLWLAVGSDLVVGGRQNSEICINWFFGRQLWDEFGFCIFRRPGYPVAVQDQPLRSYLIDLQMEMSSSDARMAAAKYDNTRLSMLVNPESADYILGRGLYK